MSEKLHYKYNELIKSMVAYVGSALTTAFHRIHPAGKIPYILGAWEYSVPSGVRYYCLCVYKWDHNCHIVRQRKAMPADDIDRNLIQYLWANVWVPKNAPPIFTIDVNPW